MSLIISLEARRRSCAGAQHDPAPTRSAAQHAPLIDEVLRRLGPDGWLVVDGDGRVVDCSDPRGAA